MSIRTDSVILFSSLLLAPAALNAAVWTGGAGGTGTDYNTTGNWNPAAVPGVADNVEIPLGTVVIPSGNWDRRGAGVTTIDGGSVTLNQGQARLLNNGTFNMTGGTLTHSGEYFIVGTGNADPTGIGTFNHSGGTINTTHSRGFQLSDNNIAQSGSAYNLSGSAVLNVTSAATWTDVNLRNVWFGKGGEAQGPAQVTATTPGDVFNVTGGTAIFSKSNDAASLGSEIRISRNSGMLISGGSVTFNDYSDLVIGQGTSNATKNRVVLSGGSLTFNNISDLVVGRDDPGSLTVSGGTLTAEQSYLDIGAQPIGTAPGIAGTVLMTGGTMKVQSILQITGTFEFRGGDLWVNDDLRSTITQPWFITSNAPGTVVVDYDLPSNMSHVHLAAGTLTGFNAWLAQYPNLADKTDGGDSDGDGISNLLEYILNGDPTVSSRAIAPTSTVTADSIVFTFTRTASSTGDTNQTLEYSADLATWTSIPVNTATAGSVVITPVPSSTLETVQVTVPKTNAVAGKLFVRLAAVRP
jgi:hypothetical protein